MDEQVLRLFADVGPHAQEALNSWVTLQWAKFLTGAGFGVIFITIIIIFIIAINRD